MHARKAVRVPHADSGHVGVPGGCKLQGPFLDLGQHFSPVFPGGPFPRLGSFMFGCDGITKQLGEWVNISRAPGRPVYILLLPRLRVSVEKGSLLSGAFAGGRGKATMARRTFRRSFLALMGKDLTTPALGDRMRAAAWSAGPVADRTRNRKRNHREVSQQAALKQWCGATVSPLMRPN